MACTRSNKATRTSALNPQQTSRVEPPQATAEGLPERIGASQPWSKGERFRGQMAGTRNNLHGVELAPTDLHGVELAPPRCNPHCRSCCRSTWQARANVRVCFSSWLKCHVDSGLAWECRSSHWTVFGDNNTNLWVLSLSFPLGSPLVSL